MLIKLFDEINSGSSILPQPNQQFNTKRPKNMSQFQEVKLNHVED